MYESLNFSKLDKIVFIFLLVGFFTLFLYENVNAGESDVWRTCRVTGGDYYPGQTKTMDSVYYCCCDGDGTASWGSESCSVEKCSGGGETYFEDTIDSDCFYQDSNSICRSSDYYDDCTADPECNGILAGAETIECGYGSLNRIDNCSLSCTIEDGSCESSCTDYTGNTTCDEKYPGDSCGVNKLCDSECGCVCDVDSVDYTGDSSCDGKYTGEECDTNRECDSECKCTSIYVYYEESCSSLGSSECQARSDCCWSSAWNVCKGNGEWCCHDEAAGTDYYYSCPNDALDCYECVSGSWVDRCEDGTVSYDSSCDDKFVDPSYGDNTCSGGTCDTSCSCIGPDLAVDDVWQTDNTIYYMITNDGEEDAGPFDSILYVDSMGVSTDSLDALSAGSTSERSFDYEWGCSDDSDIVEVCADYENSIPETDEDNNCLEEEWPCPCTCELWEDVDCGLGGCSEEQMNQTRDCSPDGCDIESRCMDASYSDWSSYGCGADCGMEGRCNWDEQCQKMIDSYGCGDTSYQCVRDDSCMKYEYTFYNKWNLISSPMVNVDSVMLDECGAANSKFYHYDAATGKWNVDTVGITSLEPGNSYFFYASGNCDVVIAGRGEIYNDDVELSSGWNDVGAPTSIMDSSAVEALKDRCSNCGDQGSAGSCDSMVVKWYDPIAQKYTTATTLEPGKGYKVQCVS